MTYDLQTLERVACGAKPTVRFYRWRAPVVSYGRLQKREAVASLIPPGWESVQRPTGGGLVFHDQDLCLSLCWGAGTPPLPSRLIDHYQWIHRVIQEALTPLSHLAMARRRDCGPAATPFAMRQCFTAPVVYDLLSKGQKVVGGALCRRGNAFLYQGSIQGYPANTIEPLLQNAFKESLNVMASEIIPQKAPSPLVGEGGGGGPSLDGTAPPIPTFPH